MVGITMENLHELHKVMRPLLHNFMAPPLHGASTHVEGSDETEDITTALLSPQDALALHHIKRAYLPSILLAYNGALTFASTIVGPEILLKNLELSNQLADDMNADLTDTVIEAGRMQDLVEGLALSQRQLIKLQQDALHMERRLKREEGRRGLTVGRGGRAVRKKRSALAIKKREWKGETLDLWDASKGLAVPP